MKIGDIGETITGKTPTTGNPDYFEGDIPFITPEDIAKGYFISDTKRHISTSGFNSIINNTISGTSILIGCIGSDMGNVAITNKKCATNQQINSVTKIKNGINPYYVYYYLRQYKSIFRQLAGSTATPILPKGRMDDIEIPIPSAKTQECIVKSLKCLDDKIENNNALSSQLESLAKTIYDYWFLQFDFPDENGRPYKSSGGKMVWNEELKREIPEGWKITSVGDITINHDSERIPVKNTDRDSMKGDIPYYGATGIMGYVNRPIFDGDYVLLAEDGSVMDENGRPIIQRITGKTWVNNHAHVLEPKNGYHCRLLMMMLKQIPVVMIKTGSIQMKINQENMNKYHVLDLPQSIKEKTNIALDNIDAQLLQIERENRQLSSLRDFLLPMLMNGQVTFKEDA